MKSTRKEDRLTAVLALGADEKRSVGGCLGDEEFALLVESRLSDSQQQRCMEHLAQCDSCYGQWKILKETQISQKRKLIPIITARSYKYIGSTLAVAATLALFLNVYEPDVTKMTAMDRDDAVSDPQSLSELKEVPHDSEGGVSTIDSTEILEQKRAAQESLKYMQKSKLRGKAESSDIETSAAPAPSMENELQSRQLAPARPSSARVRVAKKAITLEGDVALMIKNGCGQPAYDNEYWATVSNVEMSAGDVSGKVSMSEAKLASVMELINDMTEVNWQHHCDEMLGLLAEE